MPFAAVNTPRRYVRVAQQILDAIAQGEFLAGDKLPPERELSERMAVSRPIVREALLVLELLGVVEVRPGNGVYVTGKTPSLQIGSKIETPHHLPPAQLIEARCAIEPQVVRLCVNRMSAAAIAELEKLVDRTERIAQDQNQLDRFVALGLEFHRQLSLHCGNAFLASFSSYLVSMEEHPLWVAVNRMAMYSLEARMAQVAEHREILEAIKRKKSDVAATAMQTHLEHLAQSVLGLR